MRVTVAWENIADEDNPCWTYTRGLYAYLSPDADDILYVGKVDGTTVRQRWRDKSKFWQYMEGELGYSSHIPLFGDVQVESGRRLSRQLLADVESLLIMTLGPSGNIQSTKSRICRPGMKIRWLGEWPLPQHQFVDNGTNLSH